MPTAAGVTLEEQLKLLNTDELVVELDGDPVDVTNGDNDGSISVVVSGGTGLTPFYG